MGPRNLRELFGPRELEKKVYRAMTCADRNPLCQGIKAQAKIRKRTSTQCWGDGSGAGL
jgi:hypothetical protein